VFYKEVLEKYTKKRKKEISGDKDPKNIENLRDIKKVFPQAYILHIIRDPRDVILSRMHAEWSKNRNILLHILAYREQLKLGKIEGERLFKDKYYEILYEDLIENPEMEMKKIVNFLKVEYDSKMLNYYLESHKIIKENEIKWKRSCLKPILKNNKGKWKSKLPKKDVFIIESLCSEAFKMEKYKESLNRKDVIFSWKLNVALLKIGFIFLDLIYILYYQIKNCLNRILG